MTTRDELAAIECHKRAIERAINKLDANKTPCADCGMADLLRIELWKLDHPIQQQQQPQPQQLSKKLIAAIAALGAGLGAGVVKALWP